MILSVETDNYMQEIEGLGLMNMPEFNRERVNTTQLSSFVEKIDFLTGETTQHILLFWIVPF